VASLQKTYTGDLSSWIAGKIWNEVKTRLNEKEIEEREGDPIVKEAAKQFVRENEEDRQSVPIRDERLRDQVSKLFGAGLDVKLINLDDKVDKLSSSVSVLGGSIADTNKLIVNQNQILEDKFDKLLAVLGVGTAADRKAQEGAMADAEAADIGQQFGDFGSAPLIPTKRTGRRSSRGLVGFLMRRYGAILGNRVFKAIVRRTVSKGVRSRVRLMKAVPGKVRRKAAQMVFKQTVGRVIGREATERVLKKGVTKAVGKKVPGFGWVAGSIFAIERLMKGDYTGAGLEMLSGIAGSLPTVGTAASLGIDAYIITRDIEREMRDQYEGYAAGTGRTKRGLAELHGTEVILGHKEQTEIALGFRNAIDQIGSVLASTAMETASAVGAEGLVREQMQKDGLNFDIVDIPYKTQLGRVRTENLDKVAQDQMVPIQLPFIKTREQVTAEQNLSDREAYEEQRDALPPWHPGRHIPWRPNVAEGGPLGLTKTNNSGIIDKTGEPGVDFKPTGSDTRALFNGQVTEIGYQYDKERQSGYGNYVVVRSEHPEKNGEYFDSLYAHIPRNAIYVTRGDSIKCGDKLGRMGTLKDKKEDVGSIEGTHMSVDFFQPGTKLAFPKWKETIVPYVDTKFTTANIGYEDAPEWPSDIVEGSTTSYEAGTAHPGFIEVYNLARELGDPFPELTAGQWALESDWGRDLTGKNNPFGLTGNPKTEDVVWLPTPGDPDGGEKPFLNFASLKDAIKYKLDKWGHVYADASSLDEALHMLQSHGDDNRYAQGTDNDWSGYIDKVKEVIRDNNIESERDRELSDKLLSSLKPNDLIAMLVNKVDRDSQDTEQFFDEIEETGPSIVVLTNTIIEKTNDRSLISKSGTTSSWKAGAHLATLGV